MAGSGSPSGPSTGALAKAQNLRLDSATAEVLRAFKQANVDTILLKGPTTAHRLFDWRDTRADVGCELLVGPDPSARAEHVLAQLGFEPHLIEEDMPGWWAHTVGWFRAQDGVLVNLHRTLPGVDVDAERLWHVLTAWTESIEVAGFSANALNPPAGSLQLALHAAQHGVRWKPGLAALERGLARADQATWEAAAQLARELEATAAFAAGLQLLPEGREVAARLDLPILVRFDVVPIDELARRGRLRRVAAYLSRPFRL